MALLVDECVWPWRGRRWCHLVSDHDLAELHACAERLGLPRRAFQGDHYDLDEELRDEAIALGVAAVTGRDLVTRLIASGLRLQPADRRRASDEGRQVELAVRAADPAADGAVVARHLDLVPGGASAWWADWGAAGDVAVVADDGNRVGTAVARAVPGPDGVGAVGVAVARPMRGHGVARALLHGLGRHAATAGLRSLVVDVPDGHAPLGALAGAALAAGFRPGDRPARLVLPLA